MDDNTRAVMFSSENMAWTTPDLFFEKLNEIYDFTLDPCASERNHKCDSYFTEETNGLIQSWKGHTVFMNPPYGRQIGDWIAKAYNEAKCNTTVLCLLPARTDTRWWHKYCMKASKIYFVKGRLKFGNGTNSAPFPSVCVEFNPLSQYGLPMQVKMISAR